MKDPAPVAVRMIATLLEKNMRNDGEVPCANPDDCGWLRRPSFLSESGFVIFQRSETDWFIFYPVDQPDAGFMVFNFHNGEFSGITLATPDQILEPVTV